MGRLDVLKQIADDLATLLGSDCEIVIHDLKTKDPEHSIVYIINGHITNRTLGDGPSSAVFDAIRNRQNNSEELRDHSGYLMTTNDGKILKCSTSYIRDDDGSLHFVFGVNLDITKLTLIESSLHSLVTPAVDSKKPQAITHSVNELLELLIKEAIAIVGKPVPLMTKDDKVKIVRFLNDNGAFLITRSGDKVANYLGISKYTLYSYLDLNNKENTDTEQPKKKKYAKNNKK